jgi:nucleoside-diphosphate-sugar epimerase|tara:strand:- start:103 stop:690 length:588 start_codon:yes stop_codon:yes gene_type:complete
MINKLFNFKNKVILITGSSGLIGTAISKLFLSLNARVYGMDISKNKLRNRNFVFINNDITDDVKTEKEKIKIGNLNATRDFLYVEDLCSAYEEILKSERLFGQVANVGIDSEISIKKLILHISKILKKKLIPIVEKQRVRPKKSEVARLKCNNKKLLKITNWKPKYKLDDGLKIFIKWIKKDKDIKNYKPENYNI